MSRMVKRVVFYTHDPIGEVFDRRITDQVKLFQERGWEATIICSSREGGIFIRDNVFFIGLNSNPPHEFIEQLKYKIMQSDNSKIETNIKQYIEDTKSMRALRRAARVSPAFLVRFVKRILNFFRTLRKSSVITGPSWLTESIKIGWASRDIRADLHVACDLPAGIGLVLTNLGDKKIWFDAHEIFSEQKWVTDQGLEKELKEVEKLVLREVQYFSSVNVEAINYMLTDVKTKEPPFAISNATNIVPSPLANEKVVEESNDIKLVFYGGLSSGRGIFEFIELLVLIDDLTWTLDLFGWNPDPRLSKFRNDSRLNIYEAFPTSSTADMIQSYDGIIFPYLVHDLNTKLAMPNKLGDSVALKIPVVFNHELDVVSRLNDELRIGVSFSYSGSEEHKLLMLRKSLRSINNFETDWERINQQIGFIKTETIVNILIDQLEASS